MRLVTWNINSVRLRTPLYPQLVEALNPDIICFQETKTQDEFFPHEVFHDLGFKHIHIHGMKSYNGVAIVSKIPFEETFIHDRCEKSDCRHIAVSLRPPSLPSPRRGEEGFVGKATAEPKKPGGGELIHLHNLYIPAGGDEPDPAINDKFAHKLQFVEEMTDWFAKNYKPTDNVITVGDFNIAPYEHDVWSHKQLLKVVSHTPPETERLGKMLGSLNWTDTTRHFVPMEEKCYTWWSYRNRDWKKSNRGRRLDHIWVTEPLKPSLKDHKILSEARDWEGPSDHVPMMVELADK